MVVHPEFADVLACVVDWTKLVIFFEYEQHDAPEDNFKDLNAKLWCLIFYNILLGRGSTCQICVHVALRQINVASGLASNSLFATVIMYYRHCIYIRNRI